ncbi:hypothetical protein Bca52824_091008 [Brassica carinata]|uniref:Pentatricopeptide repeat-containing protein n=1 Tax=Brassica carinata TaxID=52824 RepID=A0A8X7NWF3_BRACI|nr:hypothetical protein Bca52824_091008 [Brassica carinata]
MTLLISCGEVSSSQITLLRLLNQSVDFLFDNVSRILAPVFTNLRDFEMRLSCIERPQFTPSDHSYLSTENWISDKKGYDDHKGDPEANFNAGFDLEKESVCRTKSLRYDESIAIHASIMRDLCLQGKLDAALWLREKLMQNGFIPGLVTHNHLLNGLCKLGSMDKADGLVKEMWEMGPSPNCVSYNTFIKGLCSVNNVDKALYLFSTMNKYGVKPNRVTLRVDRHICILRIILFLRGQMTLEIHDDRDQACVKGEATSTKNN